MERPAASSSSDLLVDWMHADAERRKVCFNENVKYRIIEDTSLMSPQEIRSAWYQKHENQEMRKDMKKAVKHMAKGYPEDNAQRSYRGLEHLRSRDALLTLQEGRERLMDAVLLGQDRGATPDEIASTASQLSKSSRDRASWHGKNDAKEAQTICRAALPSVSHPSFSDVDEPQRPPSSRIYRPSPRIDAKVSSKTRKQCLQIAHCRTKKF